MNLSRCLPQEVLLQIFSNLSFVSKQEAAKVCRLWRRLLPQPPVIVVVSSKPASVFPKQVLHDGEERREFWEQIQLPLPAARRLLYGCNRGSSVRIVADDCAAVFSCLKVIYLQWFFLKDLEVEILKRQNKTTSLIQLSLTPPAKLVTGLTVYLNKHQNFIDFLEGFSSLKHIRILCGNAYAEAHLIKKWPTTLETFWCPDVIFRKFLTTQSTLSTFLERSGCKLNMFAAKLLTESDVLGLLNACPKIKALRLDSFLVNDPDILTQTLKGFRDLVHFSMNSGLCYDLVRARDIDIASLLNVWQKLESLHLSTFWLQIPKPDLFSVGSKGLKAVHLCSLHLESPLVSKHLLSMIHCLRNRLRSIAITISSESLNSVLDIIPQFRFVRHLQLTLGPNMKTSPGLTAVLSMLYELALQNPHKKFYLTWEQDAVPISYLNNLYFRKSYVYFD